MPAPARSASKDAPDFRFLVLGGLAHEYYIAA
jgi:hypothetical protein